MLVVIITSTLGGPGQAPDHPAGTLLIASLDVEWTKNYRVRNGNIPFCYSVIYLTLPARQRAVDLTRVSFTYTSAYVGHAGETQDLIRLANADLRTALRVGDRIVGHQFTSDLATLAKAAQTPPPSVAAARAAWLARHHESPPGRIVDTRYDTGHVLRCASRRLVDVCTDLGLDVTQPELRGSMTAMHHAWLERGEPELRERISVLNLRHSLSAARVALRASGQGRWTGTLNVNRLLAYGLADRFGWLRSPAFQRLARARR
jgi:hypothetical protein